MPARPDDFRYEPGFLTADAARQLTERVEALEYQHDSFRGQRLRRGSAQFGYAYVSTGRKVVTVDPVPAFLITVIERALPLCPPDTHFNQCIVTKYPAGAGIGWHTDAVCFAGTIVGVSLGAEARLAFRHNGGEEVCYRLVVSPGALYVMSGSARWDHQHKVEPVRATRFSLTFRHVLDQESGGA